jgi:hypothetical protein
MLLVIYRTQHKSTGSFCFPQSNYIYKVGGTSPSHRSLFITVLSNVPGLMNTTHPLCTVTGLTNSTPTGPSEQYLPRHEQYQGLTNSAPILYVYQRGSWTVHHLLLFPISLFPFSPPPSI